MLTKIVNDLVETGVSICPNWLPEAELDALRGEFRALKAEGLFRAAGVGQGANSQRQESIRRDEVCWFETQELRPAQRKLWDSLSELKDEINRTLFLGLWDLEGHFALYPPGGFYRRHLDRFSTDDARTVSVILYLNDNWQPSHGGELVVWSAGGEVVIEPRGGTLVCFLSDRIEHEVRESLSMRMSFAGWFRRRPRA